MPSAMLACVTIRLRQGIFGRPVGSTSQIQDGGGDFSPHSRRATLISLDQWLPRSFVIPFATQNHSAIAPDQGLHLLKKRSSAYPSWTRRDWRSCYSESTFAVIASPAMKLRQRPVEADRNDDHSFRIVECGASPALFVLPDAALQHVV